MMQESTLPGDETGQAKPAVEKAGFFPRFLAYTIDGIVLSLATGCVGFFGGLVPVASANKQAGQWWDAGLGLLSIAIPLVYFVWAYSTDGQTPGKRALKIRVVSMDGSRLGFCKGLVRTLGYIPSSLFFELGFLWSIGDADKQAWHDKMAGTLVVPDSVQPERLEGTIEPAEARRREKRWLLGLGIPSILVISGLITGALLFIHKGVEEVTAMEPWPAAGVSPEAVVKLDLSPLALQPGQLQDARSEETWADGGYEKGSLLIYHTGSREVVAVWALRYDQEEAAAADYGAIQAQTSEAGVCGSSSYATWISMGVIHCWHGDGYTKVFWNRNWILDVVALEGTGTPAEVLVDEVRDALAAHLRALAEAGG